MEFDTAIETAARATHEANRAWCLAHGDTSQTDWDSAPEWQRTSARNGVRMVAERGKTDPAAQHQGWLDEKAATGWKYGPVKDADKKEHPCFLPYDELPAEQRAKDHIFGQVALAVLTSSGWIKSTEE